MLNQYKVSFEEEEKVLGMNGGDGCTTMDIFKATEPYIHLKMVNIGKFYVCLQFLK